jgi:hypothetical protein
MPRNPTPGVLRIHLEYTALLNLSGLPNGAVIDMPPGSTPADILRKGGVREDQLGAVIPVINGTRRRNDTPLEEGDRLTLRLPAGGG